MKWAPLLIFSFFLLFSVVLYETHPTRAVVPQQAQASHLVVPSPTYKYAGAVVVTQCFQVVGVVFVDHDGGLFPQNFKDMTRKALMEKLMTDAPSDHVLQVDITCPGEKSA